jgi:hypothetical protein
VLKLSSVYSRGNIAGPVAEVREQFRNPEEWENPLS